MRGIHRFGRAAAEVGLPSSSPSPPPPCVQSAPLCLRGTRHGARWWRCRRRGSSGTPAPLALAQRRELRCLTPAAVDRHIGVSNFGTAELRELKASFPDAPPATLQSKFSPYHRGRTGNGGGEDFHAATAELGVALTAYCPLNDWPSKLKAAVEEQHARRHWSLPRTFSEPSRRQWRMRTSARSPRGPARRRRRSASAGAVRLGLDTSIRHVQDMPRRSSSAGASSSA